MSKLSVGQKKVLAEFFTNTAVAWLTAGVITPFFVGRMLIDFLIFSTWGLLFTVIFLTASLFFAKEVKI